MQRSSDRLNIDHLKKQAKDLIRLYRQRDPAALPGFVALSRQPPDETTP